MVYTWTHGIDSTHGIDLDTWYSIGTPESHTYERAQCCPYAEFFFRKLPYQLKYTTMAGHTDEIIGDKNHSYLCCIIWMQTD